MKSNWKRICKFLFLRDRKTRHFDGQFVNAFVKIRFRKEREDSVRASRLLKSLRERTIGRRFNVIESRWRWNWIWKLGLELELKLCRWSGKFK